MSTRTDQNRLPADDLDAEIDQAILTRAQSKEAFPDEGAVSAMEEPLARLMGATVLFTDLTMIRDDRLPFSAMGLSFLAQAMNREAMRLFRLYHGHRPRAQ